MCARGADSALGSVRSTGREEEHARSELLRTSPCLSHHRFNPRGTRGRSRVVGQWLAQHVVKTRLGSSSIKVGQIAKFSHQCGCLLIRFKRGEPSEASEML